MRRVTVSEATGSVLDWLVGEAEFRRFQAQGSSVKAWVLEDHKKGLRTDPYSTSWAHGGPIIEREELVLDLNGKDGWVSIQLSDEGSGFEEFGPTSNIVASAADLIVKVGATGRKSIRNARDDLRHLPDFRAGSFRQGLAEVVNHRLQRIFIDGANL